MKKKVLRLLRERVTAFRSGDRTLYSAARADPKRGIREAKAAQRRRIEDCFQSNNPRQVWQGVQHMTDSRPSNLSATDGDTSLAEELNHFFARFEVEPTGTAKIHPPAHSSQILMVEEHDVRRTMRAMNPRKATGPDGVSGQVLMDCAGLLAGVFTKIFNRCLSQAVIPSYLKTSTIIPILKSPVALTPVIMKCFEKLVRTYIVSTLPPSFDPYQFAYRANRSTEDTIATALHSNLCHLEQRGSYAAALCGL